MYKEGFLDICVLKNVVMFCFKNVIKIRNSIRGFFLLKEWGGLYNIERGRCRWEDVFNSIKLFV